MPDLSVGGQAVIEGVMMRSKDRVATAIRVSSGEILVKSEEYISLTKRKKLLGIPILRGVISFFEMLVIGIRTLNFSADIAVKEMEKAEAMIKGEVYIAKERKSSSFVLIGTAIFALAVGILVFFFVPLAISSLFSEGKDAVGFNLVAGAVRVSLFLLYVWGISLFGEF